MDYHVARRRPCIENQRVAAHLERLVDFAQRPTPLAPGQRRARQHHAQRERVVEWWQPQLLSTWAIAREPVTDVGDPLSWRADLFFVTIHRDYRGLIWLHPAGSEQLWFGNRVHHKRFRCLRWIVDAVDVSAAEFDRRSTWSGHQEAQALVLLAGLDVLGILHTDDLPRHGRAGHLQADPVG